MALSDLVEVSEEVLTKNGSFTVYPLNIHDIGMLMRDYLELVDDLFNGRLSADKIVANSPDFACSIIAQAAREPEMVNVVKGLPVGVQVDALEKIWAITVYDPKKFLATLASLSSSLVTERH